MAAVVEPAVALVPNRVVQAPRIRQPRNAPAAAAPVAPPVILVPAPGLTPAAAQRNRKRLAEKPPAVKPDTSAFMSHVSRIFSSAINDTTFIMIMAITALVLFTHLNDPDNGPLHGVIEQFSKSPATSALADWMRTETPKMVGLLITVPAIFALPADKRMLASILSLCVVLLMPPFNVLQYTILAVAMVLFLRLTEATDRFTLIALCALAYFLVPVFLSNADSKDGRPTTSSPTKHGRLQTTLPPFPPSG